MGLGDPDRGQEPREAGLREQRHHQILGRARLQGTPGRGTRAGEAWGATQATHTWQDSKKEGRCKQAPSPLPQVLPALDPHQPQVYAQVQITGLPLAWPQALSMAPGACPTYNVEVGEHIALCVLPVRLLDIRAHGHQQLQVQDIPCGVVLSPRGTCSGWRAGRRGF